MVAHPGIADNRDFIINKVLHAPDAFREEEADTVKWANYTIARTIGSLIHLRELAIAGHRYGSYIDPEFTEVQILAGRGATDGEAGIGSVTNRTAKFRIPPAAMQFTSAMAIGRAGQGSSPTAESMAFLVARCPRRPAAGRSAIARLTAHEITRTQWRYRGPARRTPEEGHIRHTTSHACSAADRGDELSSRCGAHYARLPRIQARPGRTPRGERHARGGLRAGGCRLKPNLRCNLVIGRWPAD